MENTSFNRIASVFHVEASIGMLISAVTDIFIHVYMVHYGLCGVCVWVGEGGLIMSHQYKEGHIDEQEKSLPFARLYDHALLRWTQGDRAMRKFNHEGNKWPVVSGALMSSVIDTPPPSQLHEYDDPLICCWHPAGSRKLQPLLWLVFI